jgi:hypothetical protein
MQPGSKARVSTPKQASTDMSQSPQCGGEVVGEVATNKLGSAGSSRVDQQQLIKRQVLATASRRAHLVDHVRPPNTERNG